MLYDDIKVENQYTANATAGKDADIDASVEAIKNNNKEGARLVAENGTLTESEEAKLRANKEANLANIEKALKDSSDKKKNGTHQTPRSCGRI